MIEVTIGEIIESIDAFKEIVKFPLKAKIAYQVARLAREIEKEHGLFQEKRTELIKKYADKNEKGELIINSNNQFTVAEKNVEVFKKELGELLDNKVELNAQKIKLDDFDCEINTQQMMALMPYLDVEE